MDINQLVEAMLTSNERTIAMLGNQANNNEITDLVRGKISTLPIED